MNCCIFIGRLTAEPQVRVTPNGISVARFTLAVDRIKTKDGEPSADFFDIETWRGTAEFAEKYLHKGMRVAVKGEIHQHSYTDKQGVKRRATTLNADKIEFADGKNQNGGQNAQPPDDFVDSYDDNIPFA